MGDDLQGRLLEQQPARLQQERLRHQLADHARAIDVQAQRARRCAPDILLPTDRRASARQASLGVQLKGRIHYWPAPRRLPSCAAPSRTLAQEGHGCEGQQASLDWGLGHWGKF